MEAQIYIESQHLPKFVSLTMFFHYVKPLLHAGSNAFVLAACEKILNSVVTPATTIDKNLLAALPALVLF